MARTFLLRVGNLLRPGIRPGVILPALLAVVGLGLGGTGRVAAGPAEAVVVVLGSSTDGELTGEIRAGAEAAATLLGGPDTPLRIEALTHDGTAAGCRAAWKRAKALDPLGVVAAPSAGMDAAFWKAAKGLRVPIFTVSSMPPDAALNPGNVWHLAPTPSDQAVVAADGMLAPVGARRVAVVHEESAWGRTLAATFARNLSERIVLAGVAAWDGEDGATALAGWRALEADWIFVALRDARADAFASALAGSEVAFRCLFADGNRRERLLERAPGALREAVFLDGPDPELSGRSGEDLVLALEKEGHAPTPGAIRAFEAIRRLLAARAHAEDASFRRLRPILEENDLGAGPLGPLVFESHRGIRFFPYGWWRERSGQFELWPDGLLPTPGCGPPLGFGRPAPAEVNERRGKLGYLTYGEEGTRTIEQDLLEIGLSTGGASPDLDAAIRDEILGRAIRIAHRLFRRERDGTAIAGWSWGMSFTTEPPPEDVPRSRVWLAIVAGDHPAAGGQVIGSGMVAVYSTFLKRTMYVQHRLDPPIGEADRPLLDGSYRWGENRSLNLRIDRIRCLVDGFSSAVGLTLSHEFGHLCGCGHDTEHPTSIMNVVAGAGASWEDAVWIPSHRRNVTTALGIEGGKR